MSKISEIMEKAGLKLSQQQKEEVERQIGQIYYPLEQHRQELEQLQFDHRLDAAITGAGGRNAKAIRALLDLESLRASQEPEEAIAGALDQLRQDNDYLFMQEQEPPVYAAGTGSAALPGQDAALRAAFGLGAE